MTRGQRLFLLEQKDTEFSNLLHLLTKARRQHQEEARNLRISLTHEDRKEYEAMKAGLNTAQESGVRQPIYG